MYSRSQAKGATSAKLTVTPGPRWTCSCKAEDTAEAESDRRAGEQPAPAAAQRQKTKTLFIRVHPARRTEFPANIGRLRPSGDTRALALIAAASSLCRRGGSACPGGRSRPP